MQFAFTSSYSEYVFMNAIIDANRRSDKQVGHGVLIWDISCGEQDEREQEGAQQEPACNDFDDERAILSVGKE